MDAYQVREIVAQLKRIGSDTQRVEAKRSRAEVPENLNRSLCAFANSDGGIILLGVSEQEGFAITGVEDAPRIQNQVHTQAGTLTPPLDPVVHLVEVDTSSNSGGTIVVVAVEVEALPRSQRPCYITATGRDTGSYYRSGDANKKLSEYAIDLLARDREHVDPSAVAVPDTTFEDLDDTLVDAFIAQVRPRMRHLRTGQDEEILRNRKILAPHGSALHPTVAGLLAVGRHPQQFLTAVDVVFTAYPDPEAPARFADSATFQGPVGDMVTDTVAAVARNVRTSSEFIDGRRVDAPSINREVVRELVTNALVHRDLAPETWHRPVTVTLLPDRLEVASPGGLVSPVAVKDLMAPELQELGAVAPHAARNPALVSLLSDVAGADGPLVERRGSGYPAIWHNVGQADRIELTDDVTTFTVSIVHEPRSVPRDGEQTSNATDRILVFMEQGRWYGRADLDTALGLHPQTTRKALERLLDEGHVTTNAAPPRSRMRKYQISEGFRPDIT